VGSAPTSQGGLFIGETMDGYSLSVYCPHCGRIEEGVMGAESINCAACGEQITTWSEDTENEDEDRRTD
jgi:ribosomal protein S27E